MAPTYEPFTVAAIPDLSGKVALVTGANSAASIGWHVAFQMAVKGATVYVGSRSAAKAEQAIKDMQAESSAIKDGQLRPFVADLADLKAVQRAAIEVTKTTNRLDILVNNAAALTGPNVFDSNGLSVSFSTNHLAPFVLTTTLLPLLTKTAAEFQGVRVIVTSSVAEAFAPQDVRFNTKESFNAASDVIEGGNNFPPVMTRYGLSKLANVLMAKELQAIFDAQSIQAIAVSVHPGTVSTAGANKLLEGNEDWKNIAISPLDGALTTLFAATSSSVWAEKKSYGGAFLVPFGQIETPSEQGQSLGLAKELWETSESVVKSILQ